MPYFPGFEDDEDEVGGVATADEDDDDPSQLLKTRRDDPLDPLGVVNDGDPAGSVPAMSGAISKHPVAETPSAAKPPSAPGPTHFPRPALDEYRKQTASMPELPDPRKANIWAKLANVAYGAGAGWVNASGRTHVDPNAAQGLLHPGYDHAMRKWQLENDKLKNLAGIEQHQADTDLRMETEKRRQMAADAALAKANRPPGTGTPAKPAIYAPEEVAKRKQVADANGWSEDKNPGVTRWVASGVWGNPPAQKAAPVHKHPTNDALIVADDDLPPKVREAAQRRLDLKEQEAKSLIGMHNRSNQGSDGAEKPLTRNQRIIQTRRADIDTDKAYQEAEADFTDKAAKLQKSRKSLDPTIRQTAEAAYQKLVADHTARKQAIEERYKRSAEDISGQPQPRVKFGNGGKPAPAAQPPAQGAPPRITHTATNPKTGQKIGFDGQKWVPLGN